MNHELITLPGTFAVCRLAPGAAIPVWAQGEFVSISRSTDELSIVCEQANVPQHMNASRGWRCLRVSAKMDLSLVGVISALTKVLADNGICVFVVSTYDTDYFLVQEACLEKAVEALTRAGHAVTVATK
jgi:hypothetical protein